MRRYPSDGPLPGPGQRVRLGQSASHHLLVVCRHPRGGLLRLFDGSGEEVEAQLVDVEDGVAVVQGTGPRKVAPPSPALHLVLAVLKGPALEHALRMAVEVGVTEIHLATTARTVPRGERRDRWLRILDGACQQCGRTTRPQLSPLARLEDALARVAPDVARFIAVPGATLPVRGAPSAALAVGPEGGFTASEVDLARNAGWLPVGLGPWVLRADTAVAVGLSAVRSRGKAPQSQEL